jgi:hypothetical protein
MDQRRQCIAFITRIRFTCSIADTDSEEFWIVQATGQGWGSETSNQDVPARFERVRAPHSNARSSRSRNSSRLQPTILSAARSRGGCREEVHAVAAAGRRCTRAMPHRLARTSPRNRARTAAPPPPLSPPPQLSPPPAPPPPCHAAAPARTPHPAPAPPASVRC